MSDDTQTATLILWRDIPTQLTIGKGRKAQKRMLADRFMVAVDKAAMTDGAKSADDYLDDWRREELKLSTHPDALEQFATSIETAYPAKRLAQLAAQGGRDQIKRSA